MMPSTKKVEEAAVGTPLKNEEVDQALASLKDWRRDDKELVRSFEFDGFPAAIKFVTVLFPMVEKTK